MSIIQEFKTFAMRGNVIDLAVGVVIGGAFGKITTSLVNDILMPPLGILISGVDFSELSIVLQRANPLLDRPEVAIMYGQFIQTMINFTIIAFAIFMVIRVLNRLAPKDKPESAPAAPKGPTQEELLVQIRDLLKAESKPTKKK